MVRRKAEMFEPVTMGHIRGHGCSPKPNRHIRDHERIERQQAVDLLLQG